MRTRLLHVELSDTYTLPAASTAMPVGASRLADAKLPSTLVQVPVPATVETSLVANEIFRTRQLPLSVTYKLSPAASNASAVGALKLAAVPNPLAKPATFEGDPA